MSQKLNLEFADKQSFSLQNFNAINFFMMIIGISAVAYTSLVYLAKKNEFSKLQAQLIQSQPKKNSNLAIKNIEKISRSELNQINDVIEDLSTPWKQLLEGLGEIEMRDIALLSLEPNKKKKQLVIGGQAKNMQAALNYIQALEKLPMLSQVFLQKHQVDQLDPFKPVTFTIVAKWI